MSVGIVFESVMVVLAIWFLQSKLLEPSLKVAMQTALVIVDKDTSIREVPKYGLSYGFVLCHREA